MLDHQNGQLPSARLCVQKQISVILCHNQSSQFSVFTVTNSYVADIATVSDRKVSALPSARNEGTAQSECIALKANQCLLTATVDLDLEHSRQTPNVGYHVDEW